MVGLTVVVVSEATSSVSCSTSVGTVVVGTITEATSRSLGSLLVAVSVMGVGAIVVTPSSVGKFRNAQE